MGTNRALVPDLLADPFRERSARLLREEAHVLGGSFCFETESPRLLELVRAAFADLPRHVLTLPAPRFHVRLELAAAINAAASRKAANGSTASRRSARGNGSEPAAMTLLSGAGYLCATQPAASFATVSPAQRSALVVVSPEMADSAYHTRYELIEFTAYMLAARAQGLVSLHAACVALDGRALLLMGSAGAGKSTAALHCLLEQFELVSEDSVLVAPDSLRATGLANFLHIRHDGLRLVKDPKVAARLRQSPVIRRRSGVRKLEIDLRSVGYRLADAPPEIVGVVFLSSEVAQPLVKRLRKRALVERLRSTQAYAASCPGWSTFARNIYRLPAFEVRRGAHPLDTVHALRALVSSTRR